jgi:hypothetical protein
MAYYEMVNIPPDRLFDIAYAQLHKDQDALSRAAQEVDPTAPLETVLTEIRAQHPTADTLIPTARNELAGLRAFVLDHHIANIERSPAKSRRDSGFPARDDRSRYGPARPFGAARDASLLLRYAT